MLNHFALDVSCHGYIDEKIAASGISHTEIEVEFDRMLMLMDGKDPLRQNLTEHIVPCMEKCGSDPLVLSENDTGKCPGSIKRNDHL